MKNKIIFLSFAFIIALSLTACSALEVESPDSTLPSSDLAEKLPKAEEKPSYKDEHGCVFADGYEWCAENEQCIKKGKSCKADPDMPKVKRSYDLVEEALAKKLNLSPNDFTAGIQKLTLSHFRGTVRWNDGKNPTQLLASKENNDWMIVYEGESGQYTCELVKPFRFPADMVADCQS